MALFNNKGGVGKTMLSYHLAHMLARLGKRVLTVDLDPQANLTSYFLPEEELEKVWATDPVMALEQSTAATVAQAVQPIIEGLGDVKPVQPLEMADDLWLVPGDLMLSGFEDNLSKAWPETTLGKPGPVRTTTAFHRLMQEAGHAVEADIAIIDVGPNLGAINRAALLAAETLLIPLAADLFSLQGLRNLGPTFREWRTTWRNQALGNMPSNIGHPNGEMIPLGYVIMQPSVRLDRPVKAYQRWLERIPEEFQQHVVQGMASENVLTPHEIATIRNYRSLMPLAHDAHKPMFDLKPADGAIGSTQQYVATCRSDFKGLSGEILNRLSTAAELRESR
ncbi:ParA family protein [Streptomonospora litoralis]|nr:AAA family ATPase [Streptomonospora litoralis]